MYILSSSIVGKGMTTGNVTNINRAFPASVGSAADTTFSYVLFKTARCTQMLNPLLKIGNAHLLDTL